MNLFSDYGGSISYGSEMPTPQPRAMVTFVLDTEEDQIPLEEIRDWLVVRHHAEKYPLGDITLPYGFTGDLLRPTMVYGDLWCITPFYSKTMYPENGKCPVTITVHLNHLSVASMFFFSYRENITSMNLLDLGGRQTRLYG